MLSRYVDAIMIRILNHDAIAGTCRACAVPVINGLTRRSHPCQVMADLMTFENIEDHRGPHGGLERDDNNVMAPRACGGAASFKLNIATPPQLAPNKAMRDWIKATQAGIVLGTDPVRRAALIASPPTPGSRWATRMASTATIC